MLHNNSNLSEKNFNVKIYHKLKILSNNINIHFEYNDLLKYLINITIKITDRKIKNYFAYGLQNLFLCDASTTLPRYFNILILLYTYKNEKQNFDVD